MASIFIPTEEDIKRWIKEAIFEYLQKSQNQDASIPEKDEEYLYSRKEIAGMFRISLVTLHAWMKNGLPAHKQGGRRYFLKSEVLSYLKRQKKPAYLPD